MDKFKLNCWYRANIYSGTMIFKVVTIHYFGVQVESITHPYVSEIDYESDCDRSKQLLDSEICRLLYD